MKNIATEVLCKRGLTFALMVILTPLAGIAANKNLPSPAPGVIRRVVVSTIEHRSDGKTVKITGKVNAKTYALAHGLFAMDDCDGGDDGGGGGGGDGGGGSAPPPPAAPPPSDPYPGQPDMSTPPSVTTVTTTITYNDGWTLNSTWVRSGDGWALTGRTTSYKAPTGASVGGVIAQDDCEDPGAGDN